MGMPRGERLSMRCSRMGDPAAVLAVDETGFLRKGKMSAGVARLPPGNVTMPVESEITRRC